MKPILSILVMLFGIAASPAMATNPLTSDITGKVVDGNSQPIAGAIVEITQIETGRVVVKRTNSKGRYLALNLRSDGTYRVRIDAPQGTVVFKPGRLLLGTQMKRNAVISPWKVPHSKFKPWFEKSWQWRMSDATAAYSLITPAGIAIGRSLDHEPVEPLFSNKE